MTPPSLHMGQLHGFETVLFHLLAFGPFLVLAITVVVVRRRDRALEASAHNSD